MQSAIDCYTRSLRPPAQDTDLMTVRCRICPYLHPPPSLDPSLGSHFALPDCSPACCLLHTTTGAAEGLPLCWPSRHHSPCAVSRLAHGYICHPLLQPPTALPMCSSKKPNISLPAPPINLPGPEPAEGGLSRRVLLGQCQSRGKLQWVRHISC